VCGATAQLVGALVGIHTRVIVGKVGVELAERHDLAADGR
jgi:hypothetical protein